MKLGEIITGFREMESLTLTAFAKSAGLSASYIRTLEKEIPTKAGRKPKPSLESLQKIADAMNLSMETLIEGMEDGEVSYFGLPQPQKSILQRAEERLSGERKFLLERIAAEFLAEEERDHPLLRNPILLAIEKSLVKHRGIKSLSEIYEDSINVFTDASYFNEPGKPAEHFTAAVLVAIGTRTVKRISFAGRTRMGNKGAEEYAIWLGLSEGLKLKRKGKCINIFTDAGIFVYGFNYQIYAKVRNWKRTAKAAARARASHSYAITTHLAKKILAEHVPVHIWAVKGHLSPKSEDSVLKQIRYFNEKNLISIDRRIAPLICQNNQNVDQDAGNLRQIITASGKMAEKCKPVSPNLFKPLKLTEEEWDAFSALSRYETQDWGK